MRVLLIMLIVGVGGLMLDGTFFREPGYQWIAVGSGVLFVSLLIWFNGGRGNRGNGSGRVVPVERDLSAYDNYDYGFEPVDDGHVASDPLAEANTFWDQKIEALYERYHGKVNA